MRLDMGEYVVGAYLKIIKGCDFVDYDVKFPGGGREGLNELDVLGLDLKNREAYLCEVATNLRGVVYRNRKTALEKIRAKYARQKQYASRYLKDFSDEHFMLWSPVVPKGTVAGLKKIRGLDLVLNSTYALCLDELREEAKKTTREIGNPSFRMLQILEHLRRK